ncbi:hypothetical protein RB2107 [Rhodopirellula baltica SH 1]|uniref:Uncharacterized protein n=1 Tax=Rhodopirellula baltica (strain DSM 10527 / NCIMB 13988 / SH1) TaxID=243090 RepID=Q7UWD4_RHOBA|nr:hypothetical protein RB2107 [Rhodopirellula baltica SH 1]
MMNATSDIKAKCFIPTSLTCQRMNAISPHCLTSAEHGLIRLNVDLPANWSCNLSHPFRIFGESGCVLPGQWKRRFCSDADSRRQSPSSPSSPS